MLGVVSSSMRAATVLAETSGLLAPADAVAVCLKPLSHLLLLSPAAGGAAVAGDDDSIRLGSEAMLLPAAAALKGASSRSSGSKNASRELHPGSKTVSASRKLLLMLACRDDAAPEPPATAAAVEFALLRSALDVADAGISAGDLIRPLENA